MVAMSIIAMTTVVEKAKTDYITKTAMVTIAMRTVVMVIIAIAICHNGEKISNICMT